MKWDELYISEEYESDYWSLLAFFEVFIFCFSSTFYILHTSFMSPCMRLFYISEWFHNSACRKVSGYILWRFSIWKVSLPHYSDAILHLISSIFYYFFWIWSIMMIQNIYLWCRFPYFLPCLFISVYAMIITVACCWLPVRFWSRCLVPWSFLFSLSDASYFP